MKKRILLSICFILMLAFMPNVRAEELIENGGFELPVLTDKSWDTFLDGTPDLGWNVRYVNPDNGTGLLEIHKNAAGEPNSGYQHTELDSYHNVSIYQDINTVVGAKYRLNFYWSPRPNVTNNVMEVYWNNVLIGTYSATGGASTLWTLETKEVMATATSTRVEFREVGADDTYGMYLDDVSVELLELPFVRSAEITSPNVMQEITGVVSLSAVLVDKLGNDNVQWAVRKGTCDAATNTVVGNVDGKNTPFAWDHYNFSATVDTSLWEAGDYCFVFNPTESTGDAPIRLTRMFKVLDPDLDNDGVLNDKDLCPNTTADGAWGKKLAIYSFEVRNIDGVLTWIQNRPIKQGGITPMYSMSYTHGCNAHQILEIYKSKGTNLKWDWNYGLNIIALKYFHFAYKNK